MAKQRPSKTVISSPKGDRLGNKSQFLKELTDNFRWQSRFEEPGKIAELKRDLFDDLKKVPVVDEDGAATNVFEKIESGDHMSRSDKDLFWSCLAMVRAMFWSMEGDTGYQWEMNWMHTRAEVDQVYEASKLLNLSGRETRDALIASAFSDSIKSRGNFIVHNVHGAQAAALVLSYFLDIEKPVAKKSILRICQATKEHQIAPPEFMAKIIALMLYKKCKLGAFELEDMSGKEEISSEKKAVVRSIFNKIRDPFNEAHLNEERTLIAFTETEKELLAQIEVYDWYVPHPDNKASLIAHAVIAGDHSINYNNPEGFAKIALLRGPDTESFFEDETIHHSLESAVHSFSDSFKVIRPEVRRFALSGLRRTKLAVERVSAVMTELFNGVTVGPREEGDRGYSHIEAAIARAHEKHPALYELENISLSEEGSIYVEEALEKVGAIMDDWYKSNGSIPFSPKEEQANEPGPGRLPFWNAPLKYPRRLENGAPDMDSLTELEKKQYFFAEKIRHIAVELLRAEQWIFSVDEH